MMCVALWKLKGGQLTFRYVQGIGGEDTTFAVTGGTGIYADATADCTFTAHEKYGDFVIHLANPV
jgi:hypothetical protein